MERSIDYTHEDYFSNRKPKIYLGRTDKRNFGSAARAKTPANISLAGVCIPISGLLANASEPAATDVETCAARLPRFPAGNKAFFFSQREKWQTPCGRLYMATLIRL